MRPRGVPCRADVGDDLSAPHALSRGHHDRRGVPVACRDTAPVVDVDHVAVAARVPAREGHDAVRRRNDGRAHLGGDVDALMELCAVPAQSVARADEAVRRPARRGGDGCIVTQEGGCPRHVLLHRDGELPDGAAACCDAFLEHGECLSDLIGGECVRCAARRCRRGLPYRCCTVRLRRRCADEGAQPILRALEIIDLLSERGGLFGDLEDLLLLDAVRLAQLCRLLLVEVGMREGVDGENRADGDECRPCARAHGEQAQGTQREAHGVRRVRFPIHQLQFIA